MFVYTDACATLGVVAPAQVLVTPECFALRIKLMITMNVVEI